MDAGECAGLTRRERDVLALIAAGKSNKAIAHDLGLSDHTVKNHTSAVYARLGIDPWSANPRVTAAVMYLRAMATAG